MKYKNVVDGIFINRPNRFIANVLINEQIVTCHVKNTGRCKELLIKGVKVILEKSDNPLRKTAYDLISVYKNDILINIDSQAPNKMVGEYLAKAFPNADLIKPEYKIGNSRLDFYVENNNEKIFIEVKGCTLEENGVVLFPDAPTERGVKHLNELIACKKDGFRAIVIFVIQLKPVVYFSPNDNTHKSFGDTLREAKANGVEIWAFDSIVDKDYIAIDKYVEVKL